MNNQLIRKEDVSIFDKVNAFFTGLFSKKKADPVKVAAIEEKKPVQNNQVDEKDRLIREIEQHPERIDSLSDDILDKLIRYYRKITATKRTKIKELRGI